MWQPRPRAITTRSSHRLDPVLTLTSKFFFFYFFHYKGGFDNKPCLVAPDCLPSRLRSQVSTPVSSAPVRPSTELGAKESQYIHLLTERADCTSEHLHSPRSATRYRPLSLSTQGRHKVVGRKLNSPSWRQAKKRVAGRKMSCSF